MNKHFLVFLLLICSVYISADDTKCTSNHVYTEIKINKLILDNKADTLIKHVFINIPSEGGFDIDIKYKGTIDFENNYDFHLVNKKYSYEIVYIGLQRVLHIELYPLIKNDLLIENYFINVSFEKKLFINENADIKASIINNKYYSPVKAEDINIKFDKFIKIVIDSTGIYKIDYNDIKNAGLNPELINPNTMGLYTIDTILSIQDTVKEKDPVKIGYKFFGDDDNVFEEDEYLLFFGKSVYGYGKNFYVNYDLYNNPYTDNNVYFIVLNDTSKNELMYAPEFTFDTGLDSIYNTTIFHYDSINPKGSGYCWVWKEFELLNGTSDMNYSYDFTLDGYKSPNAKLSFKFFFEISDTYAIEVLLNEEHIGEIRFKGNNYTESYTFTINVDNLQKNNTIEFKVKNVNDNFIRCQLEEIKINYFADINLIIDYFEQESLDDILHFSLNRGYVYYERDDKLFIGMINNTSIKSISDYFYFSKNLRNIEEIKYIDNSKYYEQNDADLIIITGNGLKNAVLSYKKYREAMGYKIAVYEIDEIYNAFNYGKKDPIAIKFFLKYALNNWNIKPKYLIMAGAGSYDYKNRVNTYENRNVVPVFENSYYINTSNGYEGVVIGDIWYTTIIGTDEFPDIIPARITALNSRELRDVLNKIIDYETKGSVFSQNRCLIIADDEYSSRISANYEDVQFTVNGEQISATFSNLYDVEKVYLMDYWGDLQTSDHWDGNPGEKRDVRFDIAKKLNEDIGFAFFVGHGADYTITHEHVLLYPDDIDIFNNIYKYPIFLFGTCSAGQFDNDIGCIAGGFQKLPYSGFAASIAATRAMLTSTNFAVLNNSFANNLVNYQFSLLGEYYEDIVYNYSNKFQLFGDPLMFTGKRFDDISIHDNDTFYYGTIDTMYLEFDSVLSGTLHFVVYSPSYIDSHDYTHVEPYTYYYYGKHDGILFQTDIELVNANDADIEICFPDTMINKRYNDRFTATAILKKGNHLHLGLSKYNYIFYKDEPDTNNYLHPDITVKYHNTIIKDSVFVPKEYSLTIEVKDENGIYQGNINEYISSIIINNIETKLNNFIYDTENKLYYTTINLNSEENRDIVLITIYNNKLLDSKKNLIINHLQLNNRTENIIIYPNPFYEGVNISFTSSNPGKLTVALLNDRGGILKEEDYIFYEGFNSIKFMLEKSMLGVNINPGIYSLKLQYKYKNSNQLKTYYKKIVKIIQ